MAAPHYLKICLLLCWYVWAMEIQQKSWYLQIIQILELSNVFLTFHYLSIQLKL